MTWITYNSHIRIWDIIAHPCSTFNGGLAKELHPTKNNAWVWLLIHVLNSLEPYAFNALRPRQNDRHFPDDLFKCIFLNENVWISIKNSLKFVPKGPIDNIPALVQIMAWRRLGDKPLSEPMIVRLPTHTASLDLNELNEVYPILFHVCY